METIEKCIYCNKTEDLSISDIIPFAITGAKLKKKFVCKEHNSQTNKEFESDSIKELDYFRNQLGFKTREGASIKYRGKIVIDDLVIKNVDLSDKQFFYTQQILSTKQNGHKIILGNINLLKERIGVNPEEIDSSKISVEYKFSIEQLFMSTKMKRTVAKIAYEWHCYKNSVSGYNVKFEDIVSFIIDGNEKDGIVECVVDAHAYSVASQLCELGTNSIYEYIDNEGNCFVIFNFWNVIIYKVKVSKNNNATCKKENFIEMERYNVDGTKDSITFGIYSLNGGIDVISESCEKAMKRLYNLYIRNLEMLSTHTVVTVFTLRQMIDDLLLDIKYLENENSTIADFLKYEEWKRVILIKILLVFSQTTEYNFDASFNFNLQQILGTHEFFRINRDDLNELIKKIVESYKAGELIFELRKGIDFFDKCYQSEIDRINSQ
ncbi:hypothetical protein [Fusibacter sp. JL216-2]|uniref:hypothetical protein n=1 Tax=Fusibacter sp. JL216-2 TaxID=3071453 RepID=UPI003D341FF1